MYLLFIKEKKEEKKNKFRNWNKKFKSENIIKNKYLSLKKCEFNCKGQYAVIYYKKLEKEICLLCFFLYLQ